MNEPSEFVDYYDLMQISPGSEPEAIRRVYRILAARFHPDNPETGDLKVFLRLNDAYKVLMDPEARRAFDQERSVRRGKPLDIFAQKEFAIGIDGEPGRRMGVLCLLYNHRRINPEQPGCSVLELEKTMAFPREHLLFTLWYLRDKNLLAQNETSDFVITADGVDYVEANLQTHTTLYRLLKASEEGLTGDAASTVFPAELQSDDGPESPE